ncbi:9899_t:CDS:2 [Dentiscutata heterogama]|uniref:9899_t:CDS:1 n=1 Tax=Dentiscutata heterogama TaxID=1316150 RepID=A0ACA9JVP5_9GLOM|nr:9899_t:CDS:2 [Dentiscutata heterogama]
MSCNNNCAELRNLWLVRKPKIFHKNGSGAIVLPNLHEGGNRWVA